MKKNRQDKDPGCFLYVALEMGRVREEEKC